MSRVGLHKRYRIARKTNELPALDIAALDLRVADVPSGKTFSWQQNGRVVGTASCTVSGEHVLIEYKSCDRRSVSQRIRFASTKPHFGGVRRWFVCPDCGRKCNTLYSSFAFKCRKCVNAVYPSQYAYVRLAGEAEARRARVLLGTVAGYDPALVTKPKGMHWKTFRRLQKQIRSADVAFDEYVQARL